MHEILIKRGQLVLPDGVWRGDLLISGGKISRIGQDLAAERAVHLEADGLYVSPGFIDLHLHGGLGHDFLDASVEANLGILDFSTSHGVTYLLATLAAAPLERLIEAMRAISETQDGRLGGIYLEGPFLSPRRRGAQPQPYLLPPDLGIYEELVRDFQERIKILAIAPELPGAREVVFRALEEGIVPSLAHSDATFEQAMEAIRWGLRHFTHFLNGMRAFHHREPGAVGAALTNREVTLELIADGVHVHPAVVRLLLELKGADHICLVTDAIRAAGLEDGEYSLSDQKVIVRGGIAMLADGSSLAGSTLTMDRGLRNLLEWGVPLPEAVKMATLTPARVIGVAHRKGSIAVGKDADLVLLDRGFEVRMVLIEGKMVFREGEMVKRE